MAEKTMTGFIVAMVLVSLLALGFANLMTETNDSYVRTDYDNSTLASFQKLDELRADSEDIQNATDLNVDPGITDIIGGYFKSAYQALKVSTASVNLFTDMASEGLDQTGIDKGGEIKTALITIMILVIFIGVLISAMVKKNV